eukprot:4142175-Pleurochrysis_carterae.AAC.1
MTTLTGGANHERDNTCNVLQVRRQSIRRLGCNRHRRRGVDPSRECTNDDAEKMRAYLGSRNVI